MQYRVLGQTSLQVSRIGLGAVTFGREIDEAAAFELLDFAVENGINLIDTAEGYGGGQSRQARARQQGFEDFREVSDEFHSSELIIGRWLKSRHCRDRILLQTKVSSPLTGIRIAQAIRGSLERLQTDYIDLYLLHSFDPQTRLEETLDALEKLVRSGSVRHVGASNFNHAQLVDALAISKRNDAGIGLGVIQQNHNFAVRDIDAHLLNLCRQANIGIESYSPLGAGFLTGKYQNPAAAAPRGSRFDVAPSHASIYFQKNSLSALAALQEVALKTAIPPERLAMAWVLSQEFIGCTLIGARSRKHIENAIAAMNDRSIGSILGDLEDARRRRLETTRQSSEP